MNDQTSENVVAAGVEVELEQVATDAAAVELEQLGTHAETIRVELSTRFLEHFSEQLYSSPQKAFEELISNSWDAGADFVDVRIPEDLNAPTATMCVLDNGTSMDEEGLKDLWHIAFSKKEEQPKQNGRQVIGKFGIGKLATYVLATKLTYICKGSDGKIRRVTMDYSSIERQQGAKTDRLISEIELDMFEVEESDLHDALVGVYGGEAILDSIKTGLAAHAENETQVTEFGGGASTLERDERSTWTLVVLSGLKPVGKELKLHVLRRMLQAALPFGSEMSIQVNGQRLVSSKVSATVTREWEIGPGLGFTTIEIDRPQEDVDEAAEGALGEEASKEKITIALNSKPYPHAVIPEVGIVTGTIRLFQDRISGGKSDERGASNGFHVNILGRVINQADPSFGEKNLSHAAWARFRMAVRADELSKLLTTNREQIREARITTIFRAFLRKAFNHARTHYDADSSLDMGDGGDALVKSLGVISLAPLRNVVSDTLGGEAAVPGLFDEEGIDDKEAKQTEWRTSTSDNIRSALARINYEKSDDGSFVKFRIDDNTIVVNKEHPFVMEHSHSKAEKQLVRAMAMITFLSDVYALDVGVSPAHLKEIREYRDKLLRFKAMQRRQSGTYIARLLLETEHDSSNSKLLEKVVSDALRYLGFQVKDLAKPGEPEGIASAYPLPTTVKPSAANPSPPLYSFAFDAKSSKHDKAETGNINHAAAVQHRNKYGAKYSLIVAPDFQAGSMAERCAEHTITPIRAKDLGRLLEYTVLHGAISLHTLEELFQFTNPDKVTEWADSLGMRLEESRKLTFDILIKAIDELREDVPDSLAASMIAHVCRKSLGASSVVEDDVIAAVTGLQIVVPDLIGIEGDKVVVNASAERLTRAIQLQLERVRGERDLEDEHEAEAEVVKEPVATPKAPTKKVRADADKT